MTSEDKLPPEDTSRRKFLQIGAGFVAAGGALAGCAPETGRGSMQVTEQHRAFKRKARSNVALDKATYDDVLSVLEKYWQKIGIDLKGKKVFLKMNLVDWRPDRPLCTNPRFVDAVITLLAKQGASEIKLGDGPANSRDTDRLVSVSGVGEVLKKHDMQFVDLNIDDLDEIENHLKFTKEDKYLLPRTITGADVIISMPKLKTHHWALMTASMKNFFGCLPGRKYGWPKNILHINGIDRSIVDLVGCIKPSFAIVDGIEAMEGDGPLNGKGVDFGAVILGDDVVAVDTVCGSCMKLPVANIPYLKVAGQCIGNSDLGQIDLIGRPIAEMQRQFELPPTFEADGRPKDLKSLKNSSDGGLT